MITKVDFERDLSYQARQMIDQRSVRDSKALEKIQRAVFEKMTKFESLDEVYLMVVAGMIAMAALIMLMVTIFQEAETERSQTMRSDMIRMFGTWSLFYLATYLVSVRRLSSTVPG